MDRETLRRLGPACFTVRQRRRGHTVVQAALVGVATLACLASVAFFAKRPAEPAAEPARELLSKLNLFKDWGRPDLVLVLSGEMHGYLQPCGCSKPQFGGLTRRYNLMETLKELGWPMVAVDLGDLPQRSGPQAMLKYQYAMKALDAMNYTAVSVGEHEMRWYLPNVIGEYARNNPTPRLLAANINKSGGFNGSIFDWEMAGGKDAAPKVGVVSLIGPSVEKKVKDAQLDLPKFDENTPEILPKALLDVQKKGAELNVMLYQGNNTEAKKLAQWCLDRNQTAALPRLDVILCLSDDSEPPGIPLMVGNIMIVNVGHKGRHVGVVGVFRTKNGKTPFEFRYQLVSIGPEFDTPANQVDGHKIMRLMEDYTKELKEDGYLAKFKQTDHPVQLVIKGSHYVGSEACKNCHPQAYKVWWDSAHKHAYETLVKAKNPSLCQFDGECIVCHTVGFNYKTGFRDLQKTPNLKDVGCESCHGPCSEHVSRPNNAAIHKEINPFKFRGNAPQPPAAANLRIQQIDNFCQKCHDLDNDVHWTFDQKWKQIVHMNPAPK